MNQAIDGHTDRSQLSAVGKETCDNVILRPLRCSRRPELVLRATASLFRKAVEAMLRRVDRRIILLALFFPAWSILAADLPKPISWSPAMGLGISKRFVTRLNLFPPRTANVSSC